MLAAVDLGSNSFRCEIVKTGLGKLYTCRYHKETVRLAAGMLPDGRLSEQAIVKAEEALQTFNKYLGTLPPEHVYAVGTQAFRQAKNSEEVLRRCEKALGYPIELLSGHKEAELAYQGCARALPYSEQPRLVVDIGGASTELIIGRGYQTERMESIPIGCVNTSLSFFQDGYLTEARFQEAIAYCEARLSPYAQAFHAPAFELAYGSAGTFGAILEVASAFQWNENEGVTLPMLEQMQRRLIELGHVNNIDFPCLKIDRREVLAGGLATLIATYRSLGIVSMSSAIGALRLGLVFELIKKLMPGEDIQASTYR